jgi:8-oxo-dGTP pyrophosphatase MutT (NUDIX family)
MRCEAITGFRLIRGPGSWGFANAERKAIDDHWRKLSESNPRIWNGEVLMCTAATVDDRVLSACFVTTDFASFIAWRDWGWPDRGARNCFGVPAVMSADGALLLGVMAATTLNAGRVYPPAGSLEPKDVNEVGEVDLQRSMAEELLEETGLDLAEARPGPLLAIFEGQRLAVVRRFDFNLSFAAMEDRFAAHRAAQAHPELDAILALRSRSQIDSRMPDFVHEITRRFLLE